MSSNQLVLTARPQGRHQIVAFPLREHQLQRLAERPSLFMGHTFGVHGVDVFLVQLPGLADVLRGLKEAMAEMLPEAKEAIEAAHPTVHPGPMWVKAVAGPPPHILYMTAIVPDTAYPLHGGQALTACIRPQGEAARHFQPVDLMLLLAGSESQAVDLLRAAADIPSRETVASHWVRDFVTDMEAQAQQLMEQQAQRQKAARSYSLPSYGPAKPWATPRTRTIH